MKRTPKGEWKRIWNFILIKSTEFIIEFYWLLVEEWAYELYI